MENVNVSGEFGERRKNAVRIEKGPPLFEDGPFSMRTAFFRRSLNASYESEYACLSSESGLIAGNICAI